MLKLNAHIDGTTTLWPTFHNLKLDGAEGYQLTGWKSLHSLILLAFGVNLMIFEQAKPSIAAFENFSNIFLKHIVDFNGNNLFCNFQVSKWKLLFFHYSPSSCKVEQKQYWTYWILKTTERPHLPCLHSSNLQEIGFTLRHSKYDTK